MYITYFLVYIINQPRNKRNPHKQYLSITPPMQTSLQSPILLQTYAKKLILTLLRRKICRFQLLFLLWGDAVAFTGFLYGFAACPLLKCALQLLGVLA